MVHASLECYNQDSKPDVADFKSVPFAGKLDYTLGHQLLESDWDHMCQIADADIKNKMKYPLNGLEQTKKEIYWSP